MTQAVRRSGAPDAPLFGGDFGAASPRRAFRSPTVTMSHAPTDDLSDDMSDTESLASLTWSMRESLTRLEGRESRSTHADPNNEPLLKYAL